MSGFLEELLGEKLVTGGGEEVDVHSLGARGISLLGLYFGCSLSAPCAQLSASLAAFYGRLRGDAAAGPGAGAGPGPGAGAAAEPDLSEGLVKSFLGEIQESNPHHNQGPQLFTTRHSLQTTCSLSASSVSHQLLIRQAEQDNRIS